MGIESVRISQDWVDGRYGLRESQADLWKCEWCGSDEGRAVNTRSLRS